MIELESFKNPKLVKDFISKVNKWDKCKITIMEVCGTHTMSILKSGLKDLLPKNIRLISGPGCPICVTTEEYIDTAIELAEKENVIITTFGDLIRVPGSRGNLQEARALGKDIRVVISPLEALAMAEKNPNKEVIFLAIGFETTAPLIALTIFKARKYGLENFSVLNSLKTMPEAMKELIINSELRIDGFICPGNVATIIGEEPFRNLSKESRLPLVITGFEPLDIVAAIYCLVEMKVKGTKKLVNLYNRLVKDKGNEKALNIIKTVFEIADSNWRGIGIVKNSGLKINKEYLQFDANEKFNIKVKDGNKIDGCICGEILRGVKIPTECKLYGSGCTPSKPIGACMVSEEGTCAAYFKYSL